MKLIVGLGNPGKEYENTRHNAGFMLVDMLAASANGSWKAHKQSQSQLVPINLESQKVLLCKPQTFMNLSGLSVVAVMQYYHVTSTDLIVVHDELDLPYGMVKLKNGGGAAGHHGLLSIKEQLGTLDFQRIRIGIGHTTVEDKSRKILYGSNYVLAALSISEKIAWQEISDIAVALIHSTLTSK